LYRKLEKIENLFFVYQCLCLSDYLSSFLSFNMLTLATPYDGFNYRPHQVEGILWMLAREAEGAAHLRGGILADEMGLGKTWMTIGLLLNSVVPNTLILTPPVLQHQWSDALKQSSIPHRILSAKVKGNPWREIPGTRDCVVTIATYDRASTQAEANPAWRNFDRIVCDEGHVLRNGPNLKRFRNLQMIASPRKWILSGTPIQNSRADFTNLVKFLGLDLDIKADRKDMANALMLRRTVGMVRDMDVMPLVPIHIVHPVTIPADSEEKKMFDKLVQRMEDAVDSHVNGMLILERYLRIRQFMAHPDIYVRSICKKFNKPHGMWGGTASKDAALVEFLKKEEHISTIVFGTFTSELELAEFRFKEAGYSVYTIRGGMNDTQRERVMTRSKMEADAGKPVAMVIQIVAGSAGLNLQYCSRVIFLSSHWNPTIVDQAIARAYRAGQTKQVTVHHLLMADDAEQNIDRIMKGLHGTKRQIALDIHDKLYCDSADNAEAVLKELDAVLPSIASTVASSMAHSEVADDPC